MPLKEHYGGHGAKVMKSTQKTYKGKNKAKSVFYATENKRKASGSGGMKVKM